MTVFRDWPYLYDGTAENEASYLAAPCRLPARRAGGGARRGGGGRLLDLRAARSTRTTDVVIVRSGRAAGTRRGFFYFGESVLLPAYRGQGIGVAFFPLRGGSGTPALWSDCDFATFCAVQRPADHPLRPAGAVPLDAFWRKRGFVPYPDLTCTMYAGSRSILTGGQGE